MNHLKNVCFLTASISALLIAPSSAALVIWGGSDGDYGLGSNWVDGSAPNTISGDTAQINAGNAIYTAGGDLHFHSGGTLEINGGSFTQAGGDSYIQMGGGSLIVTGGTFYQGTAGIIVRDSATTISITAGAAYFNGDFANDTPNLGNFSLGGTGIVNISGEFKPISDTTFTSGALNANLISFADGEGHIDFSGGTLSVNGAGIYSGFYGGGTKSLNFTSDSTGTLFFQNYTAAELATDGFLTDGTFRFDGVVAPGAFQVTESGGGVSVSLVPEPSASALMVAGLALAVSRRRRQA